MLAWKASSSCSPRRSGMSSVLRGGGWRGDMSISWKQAKHTLQAKRAVIFRHLIYINQPTCYSVPKSLMNLIKSHLLSRREWSHTYEPVFTLANTAVQPHVKLFVRLRSQCNWVQEWHVIIIIYLFIFFHRGTEVCFWQTKFPSECKSFFSCSLWAANPPHVAQSLDVQPRET